MHIIELGRGKYSDCFKVKDSKGHAVALKLSYYQEDTIRAFAKHAHHGDKGSAHIAKDQDAISVSMAMSEVAKQMKLHGVSPHFVKVYCEADIRYLPLRLRPFLKHRLPHLTPNQTKYSHVCLMELYACNLTTYLLTCPATDAILRAMLFQVFYTLACLQAVFPGFRHNDLSANNVLVKRAKHPCTAYACHHDTFYACCPLMVALADFDFTHVPGHDVLSNERVLSGKYNITATPNDSYDVHTLLKSVYACLKLKNACPQTMAFIRSLKLDPARERLSHCVRHLVPATLLQHPFFDALKDPRLARRCDKAYTMPR